MADNYINKMGAGTDNNGFAKVELKEYYERNFLENLRENLFLYNLAKKTTLPKNTGDTITWRTMDDLTPTRDSSGNILALAELDERKGLKLEIKEYKTKLNQYGDVVYLTSKVDTYAIDPILSETTERMGRLGGETIEELCMKTLISGTNVFYAGGAASRAEVNSAINRSDLLKIKAFFKRRKVKPHTKGDYIAIIAPEDEADLLAEAGNGWVEIAKYAEPAKAFAGEIGKWMGFRWIVSSEVEVTEGGLHKCIFMGEDAFGVVNIEGESNAPSIIYHGPGSSGTNDPFNQKQSIAWINKGFGTRILRDASLVRYECKSGFDVTPATSTDAKHESITAVNTVKGNSFTE